MTYSQCVGRVVRWLTLCVRAEMWRDGGRPTPMMWPRCRTPIVRRPNGVSCGPGGCCADARTCVAGLHIDASKSSLAYGPWVDRQRALIAAFFFPRDYVPLREYARGRADKNESAQPEVEFLAAGAAQRRYAARRMHEVFNVTVAFRDKVNAAPLPLALFCNACVRACARAVV